MIFIHYNTKRETIDSNTKGPAVQLRIPPPNTLQPGAGNHPLPYLTRILVGSSRVPGVLLHHSTLNRYCWPLQKELKSIRVSLYNHGEILARKHIVKTWEAQVRPRWDCPGPRPSWSALCIHLACRLTHSWHCHQRRRTIQHLPPSRYT